VVITWPAPNSIPNRNPNRVWSGLHSKSNGFFFATFRVQAAIPTAAIPTNASEKAQLTLTLTLTVTLTLTLTHFSPRPNPIPSPNSNPNPNPLHYPFRNVGIAAVGIAAASPHFYQILQKLVEYFLHNSVNRQTKRPTDRHTNADESINSLA